MNIWTSLFLNIFTCDLFFDNIDIDLENYAGDTTPYAYDLENRVIKLLEENINKLFNWFLNFLKAKSDKCHLLINTDENVALKIKNETITSSSNQKLLGILFNNNDFVEHATSLCRKASQTLNALVRDAHYMNLAQRRLLMNEFIFLQFGYCSLVWMFHSKKLNNRIKNIRKRALRTDFRDYKPTFYRLVKQNEFVSVHQRNLHRDF